MGISSQQAAITGDVSMYAVLALIVGLYATIAAGRVARWLTFDAYRKQTRNIDDVLLSR